MGLTIHWKFKFNSNNEKDALDAIQSMRQRAMDLPFDEVEDIIDLKGEDTKFVRGEGFEDDPNAWFKIQANEYVNIPKGNGVTRSFNVNPKRIIGFTIIVGPGCEPMNVFLANYQKTISVDDSGIKKRLRTGLNGWVGGSFCKTQYANNPACGGTQNFLRCHIAVIRLLDYAKELGILDYVNDEGDYYENRNIKEFVGEISKWDEMIAGLAGAMSDALGQENIVSEITKYPNFEFLEAKGIENEDVDLFIGALKESVDHKLSKKEGQDHDNG